MRTYEVCEAWYAGDERLRRVSGFHGGGERGKLHVPMARQIAALSAGLLFGGSPEIHVTDQSLDLRLQELLKQTGFYAKILQAAEICAAYGGVFLKLNWDAALSGWPMLSVLPPTMGELHSVHGVPRRIELLGVVREDADGWVWRLKEEYHPEGGIRSALYRGKKDALGERVPLGSIPETSGADEAVGIGGGAMLAVYIPNRMPDPGDPTGVYGRSDFDGLYGLFDALDEAYSALMRDVRLGKARVIVPMEYLRRKDLLLDNLGIDAPRWVFDLNEEVFTALDINPDDGGAGISVVQPQVRAGEHLQLIEDLVRRILMGAGYSAASAGIPGGLGAAESGTALNVRERLSMQTAEAKKNHWWHGLLGICEAMIRLDAFLRGAALPGELGLSVRFADSARPDMAGIADVALTLKQAGAASTGQLVRMVNPEMGEAEQRSEVERIREGDSGARGGA